jgi:hypothetical protein
MTATDERRAITAVLGAGRWTRARRKGEVPMRMLGRAVCCVLAPAAVGRAWLLLRPLERGSTRGI